MANAAADVAALLDVLGVDAAVHLGYSGGCPHALAVGAHAPERCTGVVSVAGVVPYDAVAVDFTEGMGQENVEEFGAAAQGRPAIEAWMDTHGRPMLGADATDVAAAFGDLVDDTDRAVLEDGWAADVAAEFQRVARGGTAGWVDDDLAFVSPWGFEPGDIEVPVTIWHAQLDRMAPVSHSRWMARQIPRSDYREMDGLGHLALLRHHRDAIVESVRTLAS